ncbi:hypothetical protein [Ottowia sp.]|uniref:hypothetical protein n=1 Tax=Ottowia sp. TaxID=1898956 RepID=UPI0025FFDB72|nr:hypothetical protein [Ottowia sp.]MBK6616115.1 hypothetical protein [Ottowia sp.]
MHVEQVAARDGGPKFEGFILWGCGFRKKPQATQCRLGVRWAWTEVKPRVIAISDPLGIRTNISLLDGETEGLLSRRPILLLNNMVNELDWQSRVISEIDRFTTESTLVLATRQ